MSTGALQIEITDLRGNPLNDMVTVALTPVSVNDAGSPMATPPTALAGTSINVNGIQCFGAGTAYTVSVSANHFQTVPFIKIIHEGANSADPVRLPVNPAKVVGLSTPAYETLPAHLQEILTASQLIDYRPDPANNPTVFLQGKDLYDAMHPLQKACLLNIAKKASDVATTGNCFPGIGAIMRLDQDRFFAKADPALFTTTSQSSLFAPASDLLHTPLPFYNKHSSFKSKDPHGNIQLTFMVHSVTGDFAVDVDIDEAQGFGHALELIRNIFQGLTNPYQVREVLILANSDFLLDPGYDFVFQGAESARA
jgi:hypothetical protein